MTSSRTVYHVVPDLRGERWLVTQDGDAFQQEFERKADAVGFATRRARLQQPSQVRVHARDGNVVYRNTYSGEPARRRR